MDLPTGPYIYSSIRSDNWKVYDMEEVNRLYLLKQSYIIIPNVVQEGLKKHESTVLEILGTNNEVFLQQEKSGTWMMNVGFDVDQTRREVILAMLGNGKGAKSFMMTHGTDIEKQMRTQYEEAFGRASLSLLERIRRKKLVEDFVADVKVLEKSIGIFDTRYLSLKDRFSRFRNHVAFDITTSLDNKAIEDKRPIGQSFKRWTVSQFGENDTPLHFKARANNNTTLLYEEIMYYALVKDKTKGFELDIECLPVFQKFDSELKNSMLCIWKGTNNWDCQNEFPNDILQAPE